MSQRVCKFYARGKCFRGEQCDYSHDVQDTPVDICTFYQKGHCSYGSRCRYKHVKASQASSASSSENGRQSLSSKSVIDHTSGGKSRWIPKNTNSASFGHLKHVNSPRSGDVGESSNAMPSKHIFCTYAAANCPLGKKCLLIHGDQCLYCRKYCLHPADQRERENHLNSCDKKEKYNQALKDSQEIECNICLDRVLSKPKASECKFGMLPECDHAFCLSCIRNWRNSASNSEADVFQIANNNNTVRTCPVCRKLSYFVIPSPIWYSTKEEKQEIIDNYKANCKLIDCKHFDFGNGNCPFGARCFYKHTVKPGSVTWKHGKPPRRRRSRAQNNMDMYEMMDMLSEFDLQSGEFYSIMRESEFFKDMDPYEMMAVSDMLASSGSGPRLFDDEDSDDEMGFLDMADLSASLDDPFGDDDELNPSQAAFLSMIMQSNLEEDSEGDEDD
ncbi:E3 ubiquitin-protein ligase makorin isoform X2 [Neltuma alba]|uniref:E3 ubiquitin-protein ligase makorin isoform X2 n=1 Tax=Neltuma alba TaxID=207710 RepID=UPI0010A45D3B|nr:E3 ubiquitin-protein ligase makorin-like isoform X2 [Prosopis alba]